MSNQLQNIFNTQGKRDMRWKSNALRCLFPWICGTKNKGIPYKHKTIRVPNIKIDNHDKWLDREICKTLVRIMKYDENRRQVFAVFSHFENHSGLYEYSRHKNHFAYEAYWAKRILNMLHNEYENKSGESFDNIAYQIFMDAKTRIATNEHKVDSLTKSWKTALTVYDILTISIARKQNELKHVVEE